MNHKLVRVLLFVGAIVLGYGLVKRSSSPVESIGMIILVALLLLSMENVKRKKDKIFDTYTNFEAIDQMTRSDFVAYSSHLYKRLGYYIQGIKSAENMGCDLIISIKDQKIAVYCENQEETITTDTIARLCASKKYYKCKQCMIVTNKYLDEEAHKLAHMNEVKIVNRDGLGQLMNQARRLEDQIESKKESSGSMA